MFRIARQAYSEALRHATEESLGRCPNFKSQIFNRFRPTTSKGGFRARTSVTQVGAKKPSRSTITAGAVPLIGRLSYFCYGSPLRSI